ncbi:TonB family protein [Neisseriaceae bacterium JH1-16]|nr:TonB family protein [Neisseriaceae bacterium JH1-16]
MSKLAWTPAMAPLARAQDEPSSRGLWIGIGQSLLLHGSLALPWLLKDRFSTPEPPRQLALELFGMVSNRQVEHRQAKAPPAPAHKATQAPTAHATPRRSAAAPSPVKLSVTPPVPAPATKSPAAARPVLDKDADTTRKQQTIQPPAVSPDALRQYVATLSKAIQRRLVYPAEAREAGYVGSPLVRFTLTESGEIQPGSLAIQRSSGHAVLDEQALRTTLASAPFDKPPRRMSVVVALAYTQDR